MNKEKLNNLAREINRTIRDWQEREQTSDWVVGIDVEWTEVGTMDDPYKVMPATKVSARVESDD